MQKIKVHHVKSTVQTKTTTWFEAINTVEFLIQHFVLLAVFFIENCQKETSASLQIVYGIMETETKVFDKPFVTFFERV